MFTLAMVQERVYAGESEQWRTYRTSASTLDRELCCTIGRRSSNGMFAVEFCHEGGEMVGARNKHPLNKRKRKQNINRTTTVQIEPADTQTVIL